MSKVSHSAVSKCLAIFVSMISLYLDPDGLRFTRFLLFTPRTGPTCINISRGIETKYAGECAAALQWQATKLYQFKQTNKQTNKEKVEYGP